MSLQIKEAQNIIPKHTHKTKQNKTKQKNTNKFNQSYTLCDDNIEDTIMHNIALMTSKSKVYIPYLVGTIIK